ncbi:MAG: hypothetical protein LBR97_07650 [Dysgonamonadaceae bacterium]|nr:hypothetical protein [Dysgonamonadaceae bacterium]
MSSSIVVLLLEEGKVTIPELGYLELKVFPGKRTVLFKATENTSLFLVSEGSTQALIYNNVSLPLKEGQVVTIPDIGIFRPMKNADGSYRISYTMASALRKLLNSDLKNGDAEKPEIPAEAIDEKTGISTVETQKTETSEEETDTKSETDESKTGNKDFGKREKVAGTGPRQDTRTNRTALSNIRNASKVGDIVVPQEEKRTDEARWNKGIMAVIAAIIIVISIIWYVFPDIDKEQDESLSASVNTSEANDPDESMKPIDLPSLAEKHYGNRLFWVYIYEANNDKISSPVNIPAGTVLRMPDLWEDYMVDIRDSLEIKRAGIKSDIILKKKVKL